MSCLSSGAESSFIREGMTLVQGPVPLNIQIGLQYSRKTIPANPTRFGQRKTVIFTYTFQPKATHCRRVSVKQPAISVQMLFLDLRLPFFILTHGILLEYTMISQRLTQFIECGEGHKPNRHLL